MPFVPNHMVGFWHDRTHHRFFSIPSTIVIEVNINFTSMTVVEGTEKKSIVYSVNNMFFYKLLIKVCELLRICGAKLKFGTQLLSPP